MSPFQSTIRMILTSFIVILMGLAFAGIFGWAIYQTWMTSEAAPPQYSEALLYVATAIASLVGGVVAVSFGQKPPANVKPADSRVARKLQGFATLAGDPNGVGWHTVLISIYSLIYIVWGLAAIATWIFRTPQTPDLLRNLAVTAVGMFLPIAKAFLTD